MSDNSDSGLFGKLKTLVGDDVAGGGNVKNEETKATGPISMPDDEDVVQEAIAEVIRERQKEELDHYDDIDDPEDVPVDLDTEDPGYAIRMVDAYLADVAEQIIEELDRIVSLEENSVSGADIDTMLYVIHRNAGVEGNVAVLGGGESLLRNVCEELDLTLDETDIVVQAHTEAARKNGFDRHLLLDTVAFLRRGEE